ncbi:hypothetical protein FRC12_021306 [Ceratobasidium sp. 428]|nr:hypothetical protein FRC12_021306 [Ceratobasidium sp. 428]
MVSQPKEPATPNLAQPSTSAGTSSTRHKPKGRFSNRNGKFKKGAHPEKQDTPSVPSISAPVPPQPPAPAAAPIPANTIPPPPSTQENATTTKPLRKKKYFKKSKTNKPGSTSTGS